jgi:hypothetical protein
MSQTIDLNGAINLLQAVERWLEQEREERELEAIASYQTINQVYEADLEK